MFDKADQRKELSEVFSFHIVSWSTLSIKNYAGQSLPLNNLQVIAVALQQIGPHFNTSVKGKIIIEIIILIIQYVPLTGKHALLINLWKSTSSQLLNKVHILKSPKISSLTKAGLRFVKDTGSCNTRLIFSGHNSALATHSVLLPDWLLSPLINIDRTLPKGVRICHRDERSEHMLQPPGPSTTTTTTFSEAFTVYQLNREAAPTTPWKHKGLHPVLPRVSPLVIFLARLCVCIMKDMLFIVKPV